MLYIRDIVETSGDGDTQKRQGVDVKLMMVRVYLICRASASAASAAVASACIVHLLASSWQIKSLANNPLAHSTSPPTPTTIISTAWGTLPLINQRSNKTPLKQNNQTTSENERVRVIRRKHWLSTIAQRHIATDFTTCVR